VRRRRPGVLDSDSESDFIQIVTSNTQALAAMPATDSTYPGHCPGPGGNLKNDKVYSEARLHCSATGSSSRVRLTGRLSQKGSLGDRASGSLPPMPVWPGTGVSRVTASGKPGRRARSVPVLILTVLTVTPAAAVPVLRMPLRLSLARA
jgi:hypothetical protein